MKYTAGSAGELAAGAAARHRTGSPGWTTARLFTCTGEQVQPNGLINSATEDLLWDYDSDDIVVMLTRDYLRPNESVTLRYEIDRDQATA